MYVSMYKGVFSDTLKYHISARIWIYQCSVYYVVYLYIVHRSSMTSSQHLKPYGLKFWHTKLYKKFTKKQNMGEL